MLVAATEFDAWLAERWGSGGDFTALIVLVAIGERRVDLLKSTHLHVIGTETGWDEIVQLFDGSGAAWDGAAFFVAADRDDLLPEPLARSRLRALVAKLHEDRMLLNEALFFDRLGRKLRIDEATTH